MALGPIVRVVAQVAVLGISILSRAIPAAYAAAVANAKKNGVQGSSTAMKKGGMLRSEALDILNITEKQYSVEVVKKQFDRYFAANSVEKGGSFYIQSKIYRAKELLDEYEEEKKAEQEQQTKQGK